MTKEERLDTLATQNKNTIADGEYEICSAKNNSYGFDVYGGSTSSGANIQLYTRNGSEAQTFKIKNDSNGYVTITNVKSGKALDLYGGTVKNSQNIWQYSSMVVVHKNGSLRKFFWLYNYFCIRSKLRN